MCWFSLLGFARHRHRNKPCHFFPFVSFSFLFFVLFCKNLCCSNKKRCCFYFLPFLWFQKKFQPQDKNSLHLKWKKKNQSILRHIEITSPYSYSSYFHANCKYMFHAPSFCGQLHFPRSPIIQLFRTGNVQLPHAVQHNVQLPHGVQHNVQCNASTSPGCAIQCEIRVVVFNFYLFFS